MTLKSKKVIDSKPAYSKNIMSKQRGGSKYTVVGHDKLGLPIKSDLFKDVDGTGKEEYLLSEYDKEVVTKFIENAKGIVSEQNELGE